MLDLKRSLGIGPDNWFRFKWLSSKVDKSIFIFRSTADCSDLFINMENPRTREAYKCRLFTSWSNPEAPFDEVGIIPVNLFSARSSHSRLESLPRDPGIVPLNWFEFKDLEQMLKRTINFILYLEDQEHKNRKITKITILTRS